MTDLYDLLARLSEAPGAPGDEGAVRQILREALEGVEGLELETDPMGNLYARRPAADPGALTLMVAAHMDEVALMVVGIEKEGLLRIRPSGGIDPRVVVGKGVRVGPQGIPGVLGLKPVHLTRPEERKKAPGWDDLFVDVGADSEEALKGKVEVGDRATFDTPFVREDGRIWGKALDDRLGCALLVELLQGGPYPFHLVGVFTVQEEVGLRGARVAAYRVNPDAALILETTTAVEGPREPGEDRSPITRLGAGPALTLMDRTLIVHPEMLRWLREAAEAAGVPWQPKAPGVGGTDGGAVHLAREGVPTAVLAVPARYLHTPTSLVWSADVEAARRLLAAALQTFPLG